MNHNEVFDDNECRVIAIIPARSGSKGLINKNIKDLNGKPLLAYSIEAALSSGIFNSVYVSTDSREYADIAENYGADVPFLRDSENSQDRSSAWDVVREALSKYHSIGNKYDYYMLLQPTSPLRTAADICNAFKLYRNSDSRTLTSVTEVEHPIQWCFKLDTSYLMNEFAKSPYRSSRRQELEKYYHENGAIYIGRTDDIMRDEFDFYKEKCIAYIMDRNHSIDIDTSEDFLLAQVILNK